jgi:hypothetical protein
LSPLDFGGTQGKTAILASALFLLFGWGGVVLCRTLPDELSYAWPLKGNIRGEGYSGYILARQTSQIRLDNCDLFLS